jgi:hypothetical protein
MIYFLVYLAYLNDWYGQLTSYSLIFDALSEFGDEIEQKVHFGVFLKKVKKSIFSTFAKKNA